VVWFFYVACTAVSVAINHESSIRLDGASDGRSYVGHRRRASDSADGDTERQTSSHLPRPVILCPRPACCVRKTNTFGQAGSGTNGGFIRSSTYGCASVNSCGPCEASLVSPMIVWLQLPRSITDSKESYCSQRQRSTTSRREEGARRTASSRSGGLHPPKPTLAYESM